MISQWLQNALENAEMGQASLARRMHEDFGLSVDRAAINKIIKGARKMSAEEMFAISKITGAAVPSDTSARGFVPIMGYAAAGNDTVTLYSDAQGPLDEIEAPDWATKHTVAVRIRGTSLGRFLDGWIAFYDDRRDPPDASLVGQVCVCGLDDGRVVVKRLRQSSSKGLYHLESETEPTMFDVHVQWAAKVRDFRQV